jgi:hypothetical protein
VGVSRWVLLKDIFLTFTGIGVVLQQAIFAAAPSADVLATGVVMAGIGAGFHLADLLKSTGSPSSPPPSPPSSSPGSPPPG